MFDLLRMMFSPPNLIQNQRGILEQKPFFFRFCFNLFSCLIECGLRRLYFVYLRTQKYNLFWMNDMCVCVCTKFNDPHYVLSL